MSITTIDPNELKLPRDFVWGTATSAYQIEGAATEDGRGASIWDTFSHTPGRTANGETGDIACDHYHRSEADVDLLAWLGVDAYRFSIAWPRVQAAGSGAWNEKGFAFYDRLCDQLLGRGIAPHITLYHWDLPQALEDKGGWANRETAYRFADYAREVARRLGDRAASLTTHNEPWCTAFLGNYHGAFAPGYRDLALATQVSHHLLLSHGLAVQAMRGVCPKTPMGIVLNQSPVYTASDSAADRAAAAVEYANLTDWFLQPVLEGAYPQVPGCRAHPEIAAGDMAIIAQPIDFLGINYYNRTWVSTDTPGVPAAFARGATDMGWEIFPEGLTALLLQHKQDYANLPPIYIMENGMAGADYLIDGQVLDYRRIDYLREHVLAVSRAVEAGVDVRGYFYWSLLDNFEWAHGYSKRFGLIYVDYETQERTPKQSAGWYRDLITSVHAHNRTQG